jgi:hypothetical protein
VIAIEEALPQEVASTSDVAKKITEAGLQMVDRFIHANMTSCATPSTAPPSR